MTDDLAARAAQLDAADPLAEYRERFQAPPDRVIYFDGNSLGQLPLATRDALRDAVEHQWGERLIRSWEERWMALPYELGDRLATTLLGAAPGQVVLADSTTVCFYKLAAAALAARPGRHRILTDAANFPTDRYVLESLAAQHDVQIDWLPTPADGGPTSDAVAAHVTDDTALVTFTHVDYRSAHIADLPQITDIVHRHGALMLWDLSHSTGAVPVGLDAHVVDLAVGCTYKYLNGGPGAPAFMYVNAQHHDALRQPIWGWMGRHDVFAMGPGYERLAGIGQFVSGTPPILGLTAARIGIELSAQAGIDGLRAKSTRLTEYAIACADALLAGHGVTVGSPRAAARRGGHVALVHADAQQLTADLAGAGVIVDFRAPDVIRIGLSPLTTSFAEVHEGMVRIAAQVVRRSATERIT